MEERVKELQAAADKLDAVIRSNGLSGFVDAPADSPGPSSGRNAALALSWLELSSAELDGPMTDDLADKVLPSSHVFTHISTC